MTYSNNDIIEYYDKAEVAYRNSWHLDSCLAMHYGFWEDGVNNLKQALARENEVLSDLINITSEDIVLDAGCGVGGTSIYLAQKFHCKVMGVSLSKKQILQARNFARKYSVTNLVKFKVMDFHKTIFDDESFSVVWFVESFCHSMDYTQVLKEILRLLKPNGRLIIADGFISKINLTKCEIIIMNKWLNNWSINSIQSINTIIKFQKSIGFKNIKTHNYTSQIKKSSFKMFYLAILSLFSYKALSFFGRNHENEVLIKNNIGAKFQHIALTKKLWEYGIIISQK